MGAEKPSMSPNFGCFTQTIDKVSHLAAKKFRIATTKRWEAALRTMQGSCLVTTEHTMKALHQFRISLIALALASFGAHAASFSEADKDGDGALTLAEAQAAGLSDIADNFKKLDTDKDGKLSKAELKANR